MAQMIEHVIASAINHACFEDGVIETGAANNLFGRPFRLMVPGATIRTRTQEAHERYLLHPRSASCADHVPSSFNMHATIRLTPDFTVDAGAVRDRIAPLK